MEDFLKDEGLEKDSTEIVDKFYKSLSIMGNGPIRGPKPYLQPTDLHPIESAGSAEQTSKVGSHIGKEKCLNVETVFESSHSQLNSLKQQKPTPEVRLTSKADSRNPSPYEAEERSSIQGGSHSERGMDELKSVDTPGSLAVSEECKPKKGKEEEDKLTSASNESYYILEDVTKDGLKSYLKKTMLAFNE
jgi:hypothetical protein